MTLTKRDSLKITGAGFTIIRADESRLVIKAKTPLRPNDWFDLEAGFKSKAELKRQITRLLEKSYVIEN